MQTFFNNTKRPTLDFRILYENKNEKKNIYNIHRYMLYTITEIVFNFFLCVGCKLELRYVSRFFFLMIICSFLEKKNHFIILNIIRIKRYVYYKSTQNVHLNVYIIYYLKKNWFFLFQYYLQSILKDYHQKRSAHIRIGFKLFECKVFIDLKYFFFYFIVFFFWIFNPIKLCWN